MLLLSILILIYGVGTYAFTKEFRHFTLKFQFDENDGSIEPLTLIFDPVVIEFDYVAQTLCTQYKCIESNDNTNNGDAAIIVAGDIISVVHSIILPDDVHEKLFITPTIPSYLPFDFRIAPINFLKYSLGFL